MIIKKIITKPMKIGGVYIEIVGDLTRYPGQNLCYLYLYIIVLTLWLYSVYVYSLFDH